MKKQISLKWKIGRYLLLFGVIVIVLLFVFQILLLEPMYERNKIKTVAQIADSVVSHLEADDLDEEEMENWIFRHEVENDTCIRIFRSDEFYSSAFLERDGRNHNNGCALYRLDPTTTGEMIAGALQSEDGRYVRTGNSNINGLAQNDPFRSIIETRFISEDDEEAIIMVYSGISPFGAIISTTAMQLGYIGVILIIMIIILTLIIYKEVADPLVKINAKAKALPEGRYEADDHTNRYLEAQQLNATLAHAAEDIKKADKAKRDLIANVSHDLRTPLTMISGYGQMMQDLPEEKTDENLQVIIDESKRLNALVNDLLDLSKLQENQIEIHPEVFCMSDLVTEQMRKYDVYRMRDGFEIEQFIDDDAWVKGDARRLEQVFNNFMTNAINYSGETKHITVTVKKADGQVKVSVQDYGEGIEEKDLANIWDRYYKVDKTHVRVASGSGIGLAIVKEILELHHAQYGVVSNPGKGSTFWFSFKEETARA